MRRLALLVCGVLATAALCMPGEAPAATIDATTGQASAITGDGATLGGTANPAGAAVQSCVFDVGTSTAYGETFPCSPTPSGTSEEAVSAAATGLTPDTAYHYRIVLTTSAGTLTGSDAGFTTLPIGVVTTSAPTLVGPTTATMNGTVNAEGEPVLGCAFFYGTAATGLQNQVPCSPTPNGDSSTQTVTAAVQGLQPDSSLYVLLVLETTAGYARGGFVPFSTPAIPPPPPGALLPTGTTRRASGVSATIAHLHATIDAHRERVVACEFEFGVAPFDDPNSNAPYTLTVPCAGRGLTGSHPVPVTATLRGLAARTLYYYRVLVKTDGGFLIGNPVTFRTRSRPRPRRTRHRRG